MKHVFAILALLSVGAVGVAQAQVAVIVHADAPVDQLEASALKDIYALDQNKWDDGSRIARFDLESDGDVKQAFYDHIGTSHSDIKKVWLRKKLSGEAQPPESVSAGEIVQKVGSTPSAIGYVAADAVTDGVKVVATIE